MQSPLSGAEERNWLPPWWVNVDIDNIEKVDENNMTDLIENFDAFTKCKKRRNDELVISEKNGRKYRIHRKVIASLSKNHIKKLMLH